MHALLKLAIGALRHIVVGVVIAGGLVNLSALADQGDIDNVVILPAQQMDIGDTTDPLQKRLEFAIGEAMMDLGILPLAPDFISIPSVESGLRADILGVLHQYRYAPSANQWEIASCALSVKTSLHREEPGSRSSPSIAYPWAEFL